MTVQACSLLLAAAFSIVDAQRDVRQSTDYLPVAETARYGSQRRMQLHMMRDKGLAGAGAVCLDGTDAGFYFAPAATTSSARVWQIYFQGGGWCYDEIDCWGRSNGILGSSTSWEENLTWQRQGMLSDDCDANPDFCNVNRVIIPYCDGNSFSGNRDEAVMVSGPDGSKPKPLYFRGRRVLDAVLDTLLTDFGLDKAKKVLLSGCSAGGLAAYLHTDYVHGILRSRALSLEMFKSAPVSGFFLFHKTVEGRNVYPTQMKYIFDLANSSGGVNDRCVAALPEGEAYQCNSAQMSYAFTESSVFALNSALDSWQIGCIYTARLVNNFPQQAVLDNGNCSAVPGWKTCSDNVEACGRQQIEAMDDYIADFNSIMQGKTTYRKSGNGAFIHSCETHCEAQSPQWNTFKIGGVSMQEAVSIWWRSKNESASKHSYTPCFYYESTPHACNPSCHAASGHEQMLMV
eukprot:TRINITY_DN64444_c0_g1_i1.p1 TRINITY_DN64444_c0_g1~~TRINITY_DN64444_c0_g1_i1.p1  ORF type:complete len:459 (+),score=81.44 TRINITY_DN64444_c0_g1_i1:63-1439(+)